MKPIKNLVLGGSGTIGSALCQHLKKIGEEVISLDLKDGFDIRTRSLDDYKKVDFVWFLAWEVGGAKYLTNPNYQLQIIKNNTLLCSNTFSFLEKYKLPFLFMSSQLAAADNNYGITKVLGEAWTKELNGKIARLWNVYGWEKPGEKSHVIPDMILKALTTKKIELISDGKEERQFIYVNDCVENLVKFRNSNEKIVHLTNGKWNSIEEIANIISKIIPSKIILGKEKGYNNKMNPDETYKLFLYPTSLEEGISKIITNFNNNGSIVF